MLCDRAFVLSPPILLLLLEHGDQFCGQAGYVFVTDPIPLQYRGYLHEQSVGLGHDACSLG